MWQQMGRIWEEEWISWHRKRDGWGTGNGGGGVHRTECTHLRVISHAPWIKTLGKQLNTKQGYMTAASHIDDNGLSG